MSMLKVVVFPAPFTPSRPKHSPSGMPSHSPSTALTGGRKLPWLYCFSRPFSRTCHCCCLVPAHTNSLSEGLSSLPIRWLFCLSMLPFHFAGLPICSACLSSVLPVCVAYLLCLSVLAIPSAYLFCLICFACPFYLSVLRVCFACLLCLAAFAYQPCLAGSPSCSCSPALYKVCCRHSSLCVTTIKPSLQLIGGPNARSCQQHLPLLLLA